MATERPYSDVLDVMILNRPEGQLAYDVRGDGPLVICMPGAGDLRSSFSTYADRLAQQGFRVITTDLRGHGESSLGWASYTGPQIADDLLTIAGQLSRSPVVIAASGTSAAAAIMVASFRPESVSALLLFNPEVLDTPPVRGRGVFGRRSSLPGSSRKAWLRHWRKLHVRKLADLGTRESQLDAKLAEPGRFEAVQSMLANGSVQAAGDEATKGANPARLLPHVTCPVLIMMGEEDPGVAEPALAAQTIAESLGGPARVLVVPDVGHFPQAEVPEAAAAQTVAFLLAHTRR